MPHRSVTVLGIHDGHDAGAALIRDGVVVASVQEERPRNIKHYSGIPELSLRQVFRTAKIHPAEVDLIAISGFFRFYEHKKLVKPFEKLTTLLHGHTFTRLYLLMFHHRRTMKALNKILTNLGLTDREVVFVEHHTAHAACAYRQSPWGYSEKVLVLTSDVFGDFVSSTVSIGEGGRITRIAKSGYYDSLGDAFYSEITRYLGMKPEDHEYKVMGLAPYGRPENCVDVMRKMIRLHPRNPLLFQNTIGAYWEGLQPKLRRLLAGQRFDNVAAAAQKWLEELLLQWVRNAIAASGTGKVACAGGTFLNVKANKRIQELPEVEDSFFYPAAGDDGQAVGAALQAYYEFCLRDGIAPATKPLADLYWGSEFSNEEIAKSLSKHNLLEKAKYVDDINGEVGDLVAHGKVIARMDGRLETGPRALGNRSILADARDMKIVRKINFAIKHRDFWMPFAPVILLERQEDYLLNSREAPYMIMAFDTKPKAVDLIAALHPYDLTCRPQSLNNWNPGYRRLAETYEKRTGVGGLLNTSFNLHGYPIVYGPEEAIWTFKNSALDGLAMGNYLLMRN